MSLLNPIPEKELTMTLLMTPDMANFSGNVHGGQILRLLDQVAYACAARYSGCYVVTMSVDQVTFKQAVHVGELVTFLASINYTGRTSMEVGIRVIAEDVHGHTARHAMTCYFTMVAVDDEMRPTPVPEFKPQDENQRRRHVGAKLRRELRSEVERRHAEIKLHPETQPPADPGA